MNNLLLSTAVKADLARQSFVGRLKERDNEENGDIVQTILIVALFVLIVVFVGNLLYNAIAGQAEDVAACITDGGKGSDCSDYGSGGR